MEKVDPITAGFARSTVFGAGALVASWISAGLLSIYLAVAAALITFALGARGGAGPRRAVLASALASGAFPLWLWAKGEPALMWASSLAALLVGSVLLLSKQSGGATVTGATLVWLALYVGLGLSYAVLIRQQGPGHRLLVAAGLIVAAVKASTLVASKMGLFWPVKDGQRKLGALSAPVAAVAAAEVAAMVSLAFLQEPFGAGPLAVLGLLVALAAGLGEASGRMIAGALSDGGVGLSPLATLDAWIIALPAFFYGFRLYLT